MSDGKPINKFWFGNGRILGIQMGSFHARCRDPYTDEFSLVRRFLQGRQRCKLGDAHGSRLAEALVDRINSGTAHYDLLACLGYGAACHFIRDRRSISPSKVDNLPSLLMAVISGAESEAALPYLLRAFDMHLGLRLVREGDRPSDGADDALFQFNPTFNFNPTCRDEPFDINESNTRSVAYLFRLWRPLMARLIKKIRSLSREVSADDSYRKSIARFREMSQCFTMGDAALVRYYVMVLSRNNRIFGKENIREAGRIRRWLISRIRDGLLDINVIPLLNELTSGTISEESWASKEHDFPAGVCLYRELMRAADGQASLSYLVQALDNSIYILDGRNCRKDPSEVEGTVDEAQPEERDQCGHLNQAVYVYKCRVQKVYFDARLPMLELVRQKLEKLEKEAIGEERRTISDAIENAKGRERKESTYIRENRWKEHVGTYYEGDSGYW